MRAYLKLDAERKLLNDAERKLKVPPGKYF